MEKYFNEDKNLPASKRLRINEVGRNTEVAEGRDVIVIEPSVNFMDHPHRWLKGKSSSDAEQGSDSSHKPDTK